MPGAPSERRGSDARRAPPRPPRMRCVAALTTLSLVAFAVMQLFLAAIPWCERGALRNHAPQRPAPLVERRGEGGGAPEAPPAQPQARVHVLYSIGCGGASSLKYQLLQALVLDHSWAARRQSGKLTRIVSGCGGDEAKRAEISRTGLSRKEDLDRFDVWFTDIADTMPNGKTYVMRNRPIALQKFFAQPELVEDDDVVYVVVDPDFVFLRTIPPSLVKKIDDDNTVVAGAYSLGSHWVPWGEEICSKTLHQSAAACKAKYSAVTAHRSHDEYEVGAPYMMRKATWVKMLPMWLDLMPPTFEFYSGIESDMYAYMIASVELGLRHVRHPFMRTCMTSEAEDITFEDVFLHYCQRYHVFETRGDMYNVNDAEEFLSPRHLNPAISNSVYTFSKYWLQARGSQRWILECEEPLLIDPPRLSAEVRHKMTPKLLKHYHILKLLVPAFNSALATYKRKYCTPSSINLHKRVILHEAHKKNRHKLFSVLPIDDDSAATN